MSAITDAQSVIDALLGRASTVDERLRIADRFVQYDTAFNSGRRVGTIASDPDNPTNEEKAEIFLAIMLHHGVHVVREAARWAKTMEYKSAIDSEANSAESDLTP